MFTKKSNNAAPKRTLVQRGIVVLAVLGAMQAVTWSINRIRAAKAALPNKPSEKSS